MRTTLDIDADLLAELRERAFRSGRSFKETVNAVIRRGTALEGEGGGVAGERYTVPTFALGKPLVDLDKALALSAELEDAETARDLQLRK